MSLYNDTMCRICLQAYREDYEKLYDADSANLSQLGLLYVEIISLPITRDVDHPQFLCNYCVLQLKLFHKFKTKALESHTLFNEMLKKECPKNKSHLERTLSLKGDADVKIEDSSSLDMEVYTIEELFDGNEEDEEETGEDEEVDIGDEEFNEFEDVQYLEDDVNDSNTGETRDTEKDNGKSTKRSRSAAGIYQCTKCYQEFGKKTDLIKHKQEDHKRQRFICNQCPKKFFSENQLQVHLNGHWGLPAYQCELCGKAFKQKVHHVYHMNNHLNKRDVQCHLCGKSFLTKSDLKIHLRMHTGERRYECDICGKRFRAHTHMKNHRYTHLGKTFQCDFCQGLYSTPVTLKIHVQSVHHNICPFQCTVCNKRFKRQHHLKTHMKIHSPKHESSADLVEK